MNKKYLPLCLGLALVLLFSGCGVKTELVATKSDRGVPVIGLDYRDFDLVANDMLGSMLSSGALVRPEGRRYVLVVSNIENETMQRIDTDQLVKKIRVALLNRGLTASSTAVGLAGPEDPMIFGVRDLRHSDEFKQASLQGKRNLYAPDLSISGKIIQKNFRINKRKQQVDYYFQLTLTDIKTGLAIWEDEKLIIKRGSNKSAAW